MPHLRLAILGSTPCDRCVAACCKQNGHDYAVLLRGDEVRRFAAFAVRVPIDSGQGVVMETVLPYRSGRCQFLADDDRCTIYEDRPQSCRDFECLSSYNAGGVGQHGRFLERNPAVRELLETM